MMTKNHKQKFTLDQPEKYQIRVPGRINERWSEWAGNMTIIIETDSEGEPFTLLTGTIDQAGLQGLLRRLYSLGLPLISVERMLVTSMDETD